MLQRIRDYLYPTFDCQTCHGLPCSACECDYHGAVAPGVGPSNALRRLRYLWNFARLYRGFDAYRLTGWKVHFSAFPRPWVRPGEHKHRFNVALHVSRQFGFLVAFYTYPAWCDVPSVVWEYERTMK